MTLLNTLVAYNAAILCGNKPDLQSRRQVYLNKCCDWISIYETNYLTETGQDFCRGLRELLVKRVVQEITPSVKITRNRQTYKDPYLLPKELTALVKRKNQRALRFGIPCQQFIIRAPSITLYQVNMETFHLLTAEINKIIENKSTQQSHFLFYANQDMGPVELLAACYNTRHNRLELVNISAGNDRAQYYFLSALEKYLNVSQKCPYTLLASQAGLAPTTNCSQFYAYLLSGMLRAVFFENLQQTKYNAAQPTFNNKSVSETKPEPLLKTVNWFSITALGDKAALLATTYEQMHALFKKMYKTDPASTDRCNYYMRKYDLVVGDAFENSFQHYFEYVYNRVKMNLVRKIPDFSFMTLKEKIRDEDYDARKLAQTVKQMNALKISSPQKTEKPLQMKKIPELKGQDVVFSIERIQAIREENAKVFRRAASGYCTLHEFEELLELIASLDKEPKKPEKIDDFEHFLNCISMDKNTINAFDAAKKYNPLQLALTKQQGKRVLLLLENNADVKVENEAGKSAQTIFAELPENSCVKRNEKISVFFKR